MPSPQRSTSIESPASPGADPLWATRRIVSLCTAPDIQRSFDSSRISKRFLPKRRASIDRAPGPRAISAAPTAPNSMELRRCAVPRSRKHTSTHVTSTPATGVHNPSRSSEPAPIATDRRMIVCRSGPSGSGTAPSYINRIPAATRSRSRARPGHPLGNMENKRCRAVNPPIPFAVWEL